jgi:GxxExxY protein
MNENEISKIIVESAIEVHRELGGPGLIESVYEEALVEELTNARVESRTATASADRVQRQTTRQSIAS